MFQFLIYVSICIVAITLLMWVTYASLKKDNYPPNDDEDGGINKGGNLPIIDLPPSGRIEDILVDRWFENQKNRTTF